MMHEKTLDDLLRPISQRLGHTEVPVEIKPLPSNLHPARLTDGLSQKELIELFAEEASKVRVRVYRATSNTLNATLTAIIPAESKVIRSADDRFEAFSLNEALAQHCQHLSVWQPDNASESIATAAHATYGITFADAAIAETGTILQVSRPDSGRSISLLPEEHIALVESSLVVPTLADCLSAYDEAVEKGHMPPSQLCFISGPSATADIELVRVEGVHGPMVVHYVIIDK